jgi:hypothetical protein
MVRTSAPGSVAGAFVDYVAGVTPGTQQTAADMNNHQEELCHSIEKAGLALSSGDQYQLYKAIVALSHGVGELVFNLQKLSPSTDWPAIRIDDTADTTVNSANAPALVTALRSIAAESKGVTSHSATVSGSIITMPSTVASDLLLAALLEDAKVHYQATDPELPSYTNWRSINVAGTDYAITDINVGGRKITVSGTPPSGSQAVIVYPFRVAGSSTSARIPRASGRALVAQNSGEDGTLIAGLRRRDYAQGHYHPQHIPNGNGGGSYLSIPSAGSSNATSGAFYNTDNLITDGFRGIPRISSNTEPRALAGYLYIWAGIYNA